MIILSCISPQLKRLFVQVWVKTPEKAILSQEKCWALTAMPYWGEQIWLLLQMECSWLVAPYNALLVYHNVPKNGAILWFSPHFGGAWWHRAICMIIPPRLGAHLQIGTYNSWKAFPLTRPSGCWSSCEIEIEIWAEEEVCGWWI